MVDDILHHVAVTAQMPMRPYRRLGTALMPPPASRGCRARQARTTRPRPAAPRIRGVANRPRVAAAVTGAAHQGPPALGRLCAPMSSFGPGTVVDLARILYTLRNEQHHAALAAAAKVTVYADLRPVAVSAETAALVDLAFCKLLHNALIRALRRGSAGHLGIHLWAVATLPGARAYLLIADDGQGSDHEAPATADSGRTIAHRCVEQCGGTLTREAGSGLVWRITLPLQAGTIAGEPPGSGRPSLSFLRV